jgi:hypothetical protein
MTATAIILCLGLLLALAVILPVLTSEEAHKSLEQSGDADESSGSDDRKRDPLISAEGLYAGRVDAPAQPPSGSGSREERLAHNEDWCRDLNERKAAWLKGGHLAAGFRCECWNVDCSDRIKLSEVQWKEVRSRGNRFAVAPGHVAEFETVVKEYPHFWLIEKHGQAGDAAEASA